MFGALTKRKKKTDTDASAQGGGGAASGGDHLAASLPSDSIAGPAKKGGISGFFSNLFGKKRAPAPQQAPAPAKAVTFGQNQVIPPAPQPAPWAGNYDFAPPPPAQGVQPASAAQAPPSPLRLEQPEGANYLDPDQPGAYAAYAAQVDDEPAAQQAPVVAPPVADQAPPQQQVPPQQQAPQNPLQAAQPGGYNYLAPGPAPHAYNYLPPGGPPAQPVVAPPPVAQQAPGQAPPQAPPVAEQVPSPLRLEQEGANYLAAGGGANYQVADNDDLAPPPGPQGGAVGGPGLAPPEANPELEETQRRMRAGQGHLVDAPEIMPQGRGIKPVLREPKTQAEQGAEGWATLGIRTHHRGATGLDRGGQYSASIPQPVQYFREDAQRLAAVDADIAANVSAGQGTTRESQVLRFVDGTWMDAGGRAADSSDAGLSPQTFNEKKVTWENELTEIQGRARTPESLQKITDLRQKLKLLNTAQGRKDLGLAGRWIYVMNAAGEFFAGKGIVGVVHHSSFLAGGAVACAGEMILSGGQVTLISNASGHYRPGPAYLWQACKQFEALGVPMGNVKVQILGLSQDFASAAEFLAAMDPSQDPTLFDGPKALAHLKEYQRSREQAPAPPPVSSSSSSKPATPIVPM